MKAETFISVLNDHRLAPVDRASNDIDLEIIVDCPSHPAGRTSRTISSREIADLVGRPHWMVMSDARAMLGSIYGRANLGAFQSVYDGPEGDALPCLHLPRRESGALSMFYGSDEAVAVLDWWEQRRVGRVLAYVA